MKYLRTTATAVEKMRRRAKMLSKAGQMLWLTALDLAAKEFGYLHWRHVTVCHAQTQKDPVEILHREHHRRRHTFLRKMSAEDRAFFDGLSQEAQDFWLFQLEKSTPEGKARYQSVSSVVRSSWESASPVANVTRTSWSESKSILSN